MKNIKSIVANVFTIFFKINKKIGIISLCAYRIKKEYEREQFEKYVIINEKKHKVHMLLKRGIKFFKIGKYTYFLNIYCVKFDVEFLKKSLTYNPIKISFVKEDAIQIDAPVLYNVIYLDKYVGRISRIYKLENSNGLICFLKQGTHNHLCINVREKKITDNYKNKVKIFFAWLLSKFIRNNGRILLYEKNCNKYEESAAVLYEKLIDVGYKNVYYIINKKSPHVHFIKEKYKKNIIWAHTFKHYLNFFLCKKFIGTETMAHSVETKTNNFFIRRKYAAQNFKYIFLQHGPTYMVSLDAVERVYYRKGKSMPHGSKIVVSSKAEADHFVELGGFDYEDLYITGMPFYDRTIKKENADQITIMPTYRPWEENIILSNYESSTYYKMLLKIYNNVPEELKEKVIILPHPLALRALEKTPLKKYIPEIKSYNLILEDTALLITDYSSISYSAFYRGANVIFVWSDKEECMKKYGGHLMLNENNVFGDYVYDYSDLSAKIKDNYLKEQKEEFKHRYDKIVEFHDNNNTQRLINALEKDGFFE